MRSPLIIRSEADCLIVSEPASDAAIQQEPAERHDERLDAEFGDDQPVHEPEACRYGSHSNEGSGQRPVVLGEQPRQSAAGETND